MSCDNYMWIPDDGPVVIAGETTDSFFIKKKAFEIISYSFSMDNAEPTEGSGGVSGSSAGKAKFQQFEIDKIVDSASAILYKVCSLGTMIPTVMLAARKASGRNPGGLIYLQYLFRYCHVTGVTWSGTVEGHAQEKVKFAFKAMGMQYIAQNTDGSAGGRQAWSWNTAQQEGRAGSPTLEIPGLPKAPDFLKGHAN